MAELLVKYAVEIILCNPLKYYEQSRKPKKMYLTMKKKFDLISQFLVLKSSTKKSKKKLCFGNSV